MYLKDRIQCPEEHPASVCFNHRTSCYLIFCGVKDWYEAQTYCDGTRTKLATINDTITMQEVQKQIQLRHINCVRYWLGLTNFKWVFNDGRENGKCRQIFTYMSFPHTGSIYSAKCFAPYCRQILLHNFI